MKIDAVQVAIYNRLHNAITVATQGTTPVPFSFPTRGQPYPYGTFGPFYGTKTSQQGWRVSGQLDFWSDYDGDYEIVLILARVAELILAAPLVSQDATVKIVMTTDPQIRYFDQRGIGLDNTKHGMVDLAVHINIIG